MSRSHHDPSAPCQTCRGWSCLQCAWAIEHAACRMDCPDCDDYRVRPEEPWGAPSGSRPSDDGGSSGLATRVRRAQRARRAGRGRAHGETPSARRGLGFQVVLG